MNKRLPEYVCFNLIPKPTGNIIRLECFGENLPNKTAKKIMRKLFYLWVNQTKKGLNQEMNAQDVFPTVKKFIAGRRNLPSPEGFFPKPIDRDEFIKKINELLG